MNRMITSPLVSVLMNGYNGQKYLKEAIDSIYEQTFKDWEIIFIDNCSTDDTKKIINRYDSNLKYFKTQNNIPLGAARNFGLKHCNGKYVAFLDTDDIWIFSKLKDQILAMENNPKFRMCYGGVVYIDKNGTEIGGLTPKAESGNVFSHQLRRYEINMQSVVLRNYNGLAFNENLKHSPDFDLFMRLASCSQVYVVKKNLVKYRKLANSLTSKNISIWWSEMKFTLDEIFLEDEKLKIDYKKELDLAYAKVAYKKSEYLVSIGDMEKVRSELTQYRFINMKYFILYISSFFPKVVWDFLHKFKI